MTARSNPLMEIDARSLLEQMPDGVLLVDAGGVIRFANPVAEKLFGRRTGPLLGQPFGLPLGTGKIPEFEVIGPDGALLTVELRFSGVEWAGRPAWLVFLRDITEQKRLEEQLRQVQKAKYLSRLAGGLSHELNNLLLPIITLTSMALKTLPQDHSARTKLEKVIEAGERAKVIVSQVMTFSRMTKPKKEDMEIADLVLDAIKLIGVTLPATIKFEQQVDQHTGTVFADADQLKTLLVNLASNAIDAMEGQIGEMKLSLSRVEVDAQLAASVASLDTGTFARLAISDTGVGMGAEMLEYFGSPFFTTKEVGKGTGLGLAMVQGIVEQHGGAVDVSSELGKGTTIVVYLPLVKL